MRSLALLALLSWSTAAFAVPLEFSHQGRLYDVAGAPLAGLNSVTLTMYDAPSGGTALWTETQVDVPFADGFFSVQVGAVEPLDAAIFGGDLIYLGMRVNDGLELPQRLAMVSVPYAVRAQDATHADVASSVSGGTVDVSEVRINGQLLADGAGIQLLPSAHAHDAGEVTTGVFAPARLPNHTHDAADLASGTVDMNRLPVGTSQDTVARGSHAHTAADVGALPVGTTAVDIGGLASTTTAVDIGGLASTTTAADIGALPVGTTAVDIGGLASTTRAVDIGGLASTTTAVDIGGLASTTTAADIGALPAVQQGGVFGAVGTSDCGGVAPAGSVRWSGADLEVCDGTAWRALRMSGSGDGSSSSSAALSCKDLHIKYSGLTDGLYWIDPDGLNTGAAPFQVQCDMDLDGGGWALLGKFNLDATGSTYGGVNWRADGAVNTSFLNGPDDDLSFGAGHLSLAQVTAIVNAGDRRIMTHVKQHSTQLYKYCNNHYAGGIDGNWSFKSGPSSNPGVGSCGRVGWGYGNTCGVTSTTCASYDANYTMDAHWMHANGLNSGTLGGTIQTYCGDNSTSGIGASSAPTGARRGTCYLWGR